MAGDSSARAVALELLDAVLRGRRALDEALADHAGMAALERRDRAFARLLVATVLRRLGQIDDLIGRCIERRLSRRAWRTRDILRLGAAQLLFIETPAHAAVDTAVALADEPHKKLVNAVLRRLARDGAAWRDGQDAARLNTPDWLWDSWVAAHGESATRAIAAAHLREPPLDITAKGTTGDARALAKVLDAEILPTGSLRRAGLGAVTELPGFADGQWWVQDAAAAMPARLLGDVKRRAVIELCAAPGGKTAQLAAGGARVIALDRSKARLARLRENLHRLRLDARVIAADACVWRPDAPADAVLLDAPCSATGTIRRHPDVARLKTPDDVARLAALQERLLDAALDMLAPGGVLVYAACSLQPEEGPERSAALLARRGDIHRVPILASELGGAGELISADGDLRALPHHWDDRGGMDGFFAARLKLNPLTAT